MDVAGRVREYINKEILRGDDAGVVSEDAPLLDGALDSVGLLQLVSYLEEEFDIQIEDAEIVPDNFASVSRIASLVSRRVTPPIESQA